MVKVNLKTLSKFIPLIGIILFIYLVYNTGAEKIFNAFIKIPIQYYALASLILIPRILLVGYKWQYISKKQKMDFSLLYLIKIFLISLFYGNVTPVGIGWHIRIFYMKKKAKVSLEKCLANSFIDTTTSMITGIVLALIGSIYLFDQLKGLQGLPVLLSLFLAFNVLAFIIILRKDSGSRIANFFIKILIPKKFKGKIAKSVESLYENVPRMKDMLIPFLLEVCIWLLAGTQVYIMAQAFSIEISFVTIVLVSIIASIAVGILPISIGGIGVREGTFIGIMYYSFNVPVDIALVISLSGYLVKMVIPATLGAFFALKEKDSLVD